MAAYDYHYRGTKIHFDSSKQYGFYGPSGFVQLEVRPYLRDISKAKEHPGKRIKNTLTFLVANGNAPTKELAKQMLENLF